MAANICQLRISCRWHEETNGSAVTSLVESSDGDQLFCGRSPEYSDHSHDRHCIHVLSTKDGTPIKALSAPGQGPVIQLTLDSASQSRNVIICCRADGTVSWIETGTGDIIRTMVLPICDSSKSPLHKTKCSSKNSTTPISGPPIPEDASLSPVPASPDARPKYIEAAGYRGPQEGYCYRNDGSFGKGYYRKDVVLQYSSSQGVQGHAGLLEQAKANQVRCCAICPQGNWLATASNRPDDGNITVWDLSTTDESDGHDQVPLASLRGHGLGVLTLVISQDGQYLVSGSYDKTVRMWKMSPKIEQHCTNVIKGHAGGVHAVAFLTHSRTLFTAGSDNTLRMWDLDHLVCRRFLGGRHEDTTWPACMAMWSSTDDELDSTHKPSSVLISGSTGPFGASTLKAFCPVTGECLATFAHLGYEVRGGITALSVSRNGKLVFSGASVGSVAAWELTWEDKVQKKEGSLRRGFFS